MNLQAGAALDIMELLAMVDRLEQEGQSDQAITLYRGWIAGNEDHPLLYAVLFNFGTLHNRLNDAVEAANCFHRAVQINPDFLPPYINLGNILEQAGDRLGAVGHWRTLIDRLPGINRDAITHKLMALKLLGRVLAGADLDDLAEQALFEIITLDPHQQDICQHWLNLRQRQCRWPPLAPLGPTEQELVLAAIAPLSLASYSDDPLWQLANAAAFNRKETGRPTDCLPDRPPAASPKSLRIGYLSSDLCEHAVGYLTAEIYGLHDRTKLEVFVYYNGTSQGDRIQNRIRPGVDQWRDIRSLSDLAAARLIASDQIDILVDLNGHTKDARTAMLGHNPAPIIVNWLGFPGSLGSPFHHYIIADDFIIPPEAEMFYSEKVMRLPCYQPLDRQREVAREPISRADFGLPDDVMVYCCFNEPRKITEQTWRNWEQILTRVPESVLWLLVPSASTQTHLRAMANDQGIAPERLVFAGRRINQEHLARYPLADLILDSFPYGAHTTASDALWMGVPVVTKPGLCFASRVCGSLLQAAGLPEMICEDDHAYIARAVELGLDPAKRQALRDKLALLRADCLLFDTPQLVRALEEIYRKMWDEFAGGLLPRPDLANLEIYRDIGIELDLAPEPEIPYLDRYRRKLQSRKPYSYLVPDRRLWPGS